MAVLKADLEKCEGYANCVEVAPDFFDLGDDGVVIALRSQVDPSDRSRLEAAVLGCPRSALSIEG